MNATRTIAVLVGMLCAAAGAAPDTQSAEQKLPPGKAPGTFHLVYRGTVRFTLEPAYPTVVSITSNFTGTAAKTGVADDKPFTLEADLVPGTYWVESNAKGEPAKSPYWPVNGGQLHIDKDGNLSRPTGPTGPTDKLVHVHKMSGLSPANLEIAGADAPVIKWPPVAGAKHYMGDIRIGESFRSFKTDDTRYQLPEIVPSLMCEWELWAQDEKGQTLASGFASFYAHGTDPAIAKKGSQPTSLPAFHFPTTGGYLGMVPTSGSVTKDPKKTKRIVSGSHVGLLISAGAEMIPCIGVGEIVPGSPALKAGLLPGDSILAVDGKPVPEAKDGVDNPSDVKEFVDQIRAMRPGTVVTFTIRRDSAELELPVTIGRPPAPATQPAGREQ